MRFLSFCHISGDLIFSTLKFLFLPQDYLEFLTYKFLFNLHFIHV